MNITYHYHSSTLHEAQIEQHHILEKKKVSVQKIGTQHKICVHVCVFAHAYRYDV